MWRRPAFGFLHTRVVGGSAHARACHCVCRAGAAEPVVGSKPQSSWAAFDAAAAWRWEGATWKVEVVICWGRAGGCAHLQRHLLPILQRCVRGGAGRVRVARHAGQGCVQLLQQSRSLRRLGSTASRGSVCDHPWGCKIYQRRVQGGEGRARIAAWTIGPCVPRSQYCADPERYDCWKIAEQRNPWEWAAVVVRWSGCGVAAVSGARRARCVRSPRACHWVHWESRAETCPEEA